MTLLTDHTSTSDWEVLALDARSWRICDATRSSDDPARLIAYAEKGVAGLVDVLWLTSPAPHRTRFRSLSEAFASWRASRDTPV